MRRFYSSTYLTHNVLSLPAVQDKGAKARLFRVWARTVALLLPPA